jgi:sugar lactone lactonase YvrE
MTANNQSKQNPKETAAFSGLQTLTAGLAFGESPRWHEDRLWVSDWGAREIIAVDLEGKSEVMVRLRFPSFQAICIDWLPDGRLLIVSRRAIDLWQRLSGT